MNDRNRPLYMIGVAAELSGCSSANLAHLRAKRFGESPTYARQYAYVFSGRHRAPAADQRTHERGINLAGVIRILDLQGRLNERDDEIDDLHKRVRRLADRVHELETFEHVSSLVAQSTSLELRRIR